MSSTRNSKFDGPAELPRVYVQSALANTPADGKTWSVTDAAGLQTALNSSACGDTISLKRSHFTGSWTFLERVAMTSTGSLSHLGPGLQLAA